MASKKQMEQLRADPEALATYIDQRVKTKVAMELLKQQKGGKR